MTQLLAKSAPPGGRARTLVEHTLDVVEAAEALFGFADRSTRLGREWVRFFRLDQTQWSRFHANLLAACLFHDWGKANQGMQDVLAGRSGGQLFRHEHLSVLLLGHDGVERWVCQRSDIDWDVVLGAVGSHHLKFGDQSFAPDDGTGAAVRVLFDHDDFRRDLVSLTAARLQLSGAPAIPAPRYWGFGGGTTTFDPTELREGLRDGRLRRLSRAPDQRMLNAVRAALIAADAAGSGLPRTGRRIDWIGGQFPETPGCDSVTVAGVIDRRIADLTSRNKWVHWNEFQNQCETLSARALLLAPCGAGKTLAAWRWIAGRVKQRPVNRVLFLYPTRATATEGFKDYVSWAPEADAALMHGTAGYDLNGMFAVEDPRAKKAFTTTDPRLFALQHWPKRIVSATVDQFFGFMAYGYGPMCLLPVLADSVIVVDEVHSFDRSMFSALLGFLSAFDVPVLCMTATLPEPRQKQLVAAGLTLSNPRPDDLKTIADTPRYRVARVNEREVEDRIRAAVGSGKRRVLWVVNQVSRAQAIAARLTDLSLSPICYHSRFKLDDRVKRHQETVKAIRAGEPAAVAVTTQVCEMSLDIDADLLVTEACPITSLIQRMGRCRRGRDEVTSKGPGEVLIYAPAKERVYSSDDLAGLDGFISFLIGLPSPASQADLEIGLDRFGPKGADAPKLNSFLASGAYAEASEDSFRDIEAFNVSAVLASEVGAYVTAAESKDCMTRAKAPGFVVPVPRKLRPVQDPRLPHYLFAADDRHYDPQTGYWDYPIC
ncbi:Putative CRISPR-associated nuclease/helicase Cas3 [Gemmata obscuriglobus]|uniref:CRISPR-associated helicase Cas3' n=1 Tax=Gemmata obscuriglobus TaxID=114 RepID=UPI000311B870|nr:Putative CRISPR-associated nuclease/helicase Cas3 [Gemmata obscuriglobus]VTS09496.1 crispr-associated helicase cas3 : CRISPR-associated helicase Cas3 OS=Desulfococcus multivorans DSM 2059 GN=dsmv_2501 PE=4 SV=1: DEAD [Gemmata obscuriglobus UQM 2246]